MWVTEILKRNETDTFLRGNRVESWLGYHDSYALILEPLLLLTHPQATKSAMPTAYANTRP